jgi:hypothetical protein
MKIYSSNASNYYDFEFYVGKDLWVKTSSPINPEVTPYLRIVSINNNTITYNYMPAYFLDGEVQLTSGRQFDDIMDMLDNPGHSKYYRGDAPTWALHIIEPVEVITTEEIKEVLESSVHGD